MSYQLRFAGTLSVAAMFLVTLFSAQGSGAAAKAPAEALTPPAVEQAAQTQPSSVTFVSQPVVQQLPVGAAQPSIADEVPALPVREASSLAQLVSQQAVPGQLSSELNCLAGAIYFEAKGESLEGQLAVGRVIVARSKSGRFPASYCGVVYQRSQFSFVRGNTMPGINKSSRHWSNAVRIARIAHEGSWQSPVEGALFFHAAYVSPGWKLRRLARVDNHVFYR